MNLPPDAPTHRLRSATTGDWPAIAALLESNGLPTDGARTHLPGFVVAEDHARLIACAGVELHGTAALLRSVAVVEDCRGQGLAGALVAQLIDRARASGATSIYLLTTTAGNYFPRFGFREGARADAPDALQASEEFRGACPASAQLMALRL